MDSEHMCKANVFVNGKMRPCSRRRGRFHGGWCWQHDPVAQGLEPPPS